MNERNERNGAWCSGRTGAGGVDLRFLVWCSVSVQDVCALGMLSADRSTHSTIPQFPQISYPSKMGGISTVLRTLDPISGTGDWYRRVQASAHRDPLHASRHKASADYRLEAPRTR